MSAKASDLLHWVADHLDITDRLVKQVAEARGEAVGDLTNEAQEDLRAIADALKSIPHEDERLGSHATHWISEGMDEEE